MKRGRLKNLKVGKKLMYSYGVIIFLYVTTVVAAMLGIHTVSNTMDIFYSKSFQVNRTAQEIRASIQGIGRDILSIATAVQVRDEESYLKEAKDYASTVDAEMNSLQKDFTSNPALLDEVCQNIEQLSPVRDTLLELWSRGKRTR